MTRVPLILAVEDDPRNQALLRAMFDDRAYRLEVCRTAAESRAWLAQHRPDLVLLDLRLPDESGMTVARALRAAPATRAIPIIAVSASVLERDRTAALAAGCDELIEKPISPRALLGRVRHHLGAAQPAPGSRRGRSVQASELAHGG